MQEASEEESAPAETKETIQPRLIVCEQEAKSEEAAEAKEIVEPRTDVFIEARTSAELKKTDGMMIAAETRQESNLQAPTPSKENETRGGSQAFATALAKTWATAAPPPHPRCAISAIYSLYSPLHAII